MAQPKSMIKYLCLLAMVSYSLSSLAAPLDGERLLGQQLEVLEDPDGKLSIADVNTMPFLSADVDIPNFGLSNSTFWLRLGLSEQIGPIIEVSNNQIDRIDVFYLEKGRIVQSESSGLIILAGSKKTLGHTFRIEAGSNADQVLFKIKSNKPLLLPIYSRSEESHSRVALSRSLIYGTYIGMMFFLFLYNIFIFLSTKDKSYLRYVVYIALVAITQLIFHGFGHNYFWPWSSWLSSNATTIFTLLTAIAANEFMIRFIGSGKALPKLTTLSRGVYWLMAIGFLLRLTVFPLFAYEALRAIVGGFAFLQLATAIIMLIRGKRTAGFFLIAWTVFLVGIVLFALKDASILPLNLFTEHTMIFGSALEGILLSFGLADKIKILRREKLISQEQALQAAKENERIIREQNVILEEKVTERTQDLQRSNRELKETQSQLVDAEKMASLGQLTAGIAHEINNPLNFISTSIPPLKRDMEEIIELMQLQLGYIDRQNSDDARAILERAKELDITYTLEEVETIISNIEEGTSRTTEIVRGLRNFSRLDEEGMKEARIDEGVNSTIVLLNPELKQGIEIVQELVEAPPMLCFPGKLNQVLMNLMNNGLQAIRQKFKAERGGKLLIKTLLSATTYTIEIHDNGVGMDQEIQNRVFEPFFTTKDVGEGTGLGLSIAHGIIESHNGNISVQSEKGEGSCFSITIPLTQEEHLHRA